MTYKKVHQNQEFLALVLQLSQISLVCSGLFVENFLNRRKFQRLTKSYRGFRKNLKSLVTHFRDEKSYLKPQDVCKPTSYFEHTNTLEVPKSRFAS